LGKKNIFLGKKIFYYLYISIWVDIDGATELVAKQGKEGPW
jgi:hypothetical protein